MIYNNCHFTQINGRNAWILFASMVYLAVFTNNGELVLIYFWVGSFFVIKTLCTNIRWIDPKSKGSENLAMACDFLPRSFRSHDIKRPDDDFDDAEDDDTASSDG